MFRTFDPLLVASQNVPFEDGASLEFRARQGGPDWNDMRVEFEWTGAFDPSFRGAAQFDPATRVLSFSVVQNRTTPTDLIRILEKSAVREDPAGANFIAVATSSEGLDRPMTELPAAVLLRGSGMNQNLKWTEFGSNLPNAIVTTIEYRDPAVGIDQAGNLFPIGDVLSVGTLGRGVWKIANADVPGPVGGMLAEEPILRVKGTDQPDRFLLRQNQDNPLRFDLESGGEVDTFFASEIQPYRSGIRRCVGVCPLAGFGERAFQAVARRDR